MVAIAAIAVVFLGGGQRAFAATISGQTFLDLDGNGACGSSEAGADGVAIELVAAGSGLVVTSQVTASQANLDGNPALDPRTESGLYEFTGVTAGVYEVRQALAADAEQTLPEGSKSYLLTVADGDNIGAPPATAAVSCPGGVNWLYGCQPGAEQFFSTLSIDVDLRDPGDGTFDGVPDETVFLAGEATVIHPHNSWFSLANTEETLDVELLSLDLAGSSSILGALTLSAGDGLNPEGVFDDGPLHSPGTFVSQTGFLEFPPSFLAWATFSVSLQITGTNGAWHNDPPLDFGNLLTEFVRYGRTFFAQPAPPLPLVDTGSVERARIVSARWTHRTGVDFGHRAIRYDFADAPAPYPTLTAAAGARHQIVADGPFLGAGPPDDESDGLPDPAAEGDDADGADDEDGLLAFVGSASGTNTVAGGEAYALHLLLGGTGYLNAWVDINRDGDWDDANDHVVTDRFFATGNTPFTLAISSTAPLNAVPGDTFLRLRVTSVPGLGPAGAAADGEVEDYALTLLAPPGELDFADAPAPYATLFEDDGARHVIDEFGPSLGLNRPDAETNGLPSAAADGDDGDDAFDDEDGLVTFSGVTNGARAVAPDEDYILAIRVRGAGYANAWIDFDRDRTWETSEQVLDDISFDAGSTSQVLTAAGTAPTNAIPGPSYLRLRVGSESGLAPQGIATDGEAEDYAFSIPAATGLFDFGDAPDMTNNGTLRVHYPVTLAEDGARHLIDLDGPYLGTFPDAEADGLSDGTATGDDADGIDDEDGVTNIVNLVPGTTHDFFVNVVASNGAYLNAWLDLNGDGDWDDPGEQIADDVAVTSGSTVVSVALPDPMPQETYARFRIAHDPGLDVNGPAPDGEVEDHRMIVPFGSVDVETYTLNTTFAFGAVNFSPEIGLPDVLDIRAGSEFSVALAEEIRDTYPFPAALVEAGQMLVDRYGSLDNRTLLTSNLVQYGNAGDQLYDAFEAVRVALEETTQRLVTGTISNQFVESQSHSLFGGALVDGASDLTAIVGTANVGFYHVTASFEFAPLDMGDATDTGVGSAYATRLVDDGPRHGAPDGGPYLGAALPDTEDEGQPNPGATGDDGDGVDDEDGVTGLAADLIPGEQRTITLDIEAHFPQPGIANPLSVEESNGVGQGYDGFGAGSSRRSMLAVSGKLLVAHELADVHTTTGTVDAAGLLHVFDTTTGALVYSLQSPEPRRFDRFGLGAEVLQGRVFESYRSPTDTYAIVGFDLDDGSPELTIPNPNPGRRLDLVAASRTNLIALAGSTNILLPPDEVLFFDPSGGSFVRSFPITPGQLAGSVFHVEVVVVSNVLALSDARADVGATNDAGSVFIYDVDTGQFLRRIDNPTLAEDDHFGGALERLGSKLVVGAALDSDANGDPLLGRGTIYVFDPATGALELTIPNPEPGDQSFMAEPMVADGTKIFAGVRPSIFTNAPPHTGRVYVFNGTNGQLEATIENPDPGGGRIDWFGHGVAVTSNRIFAADSRGEQYDGGGDVFEEDRGVVFRFDRATGAHLPYPDGDEGTLSGWIDFNGDGEFDGPGETIIDEMAVTTGVLQVQFDVPGDAAGGPAVARFRISREDGVGPLGLARMGEVEDHLVTIYRDPALAYDFGDAPVATQSLFSADYPTLLTNDGARHLIVTGGPRLGAAPDGEADGQPDALAAGDDLAALDDEDGIAGLDTPLVAGSTVTVTVVATTLATGAYLNAWIDYDADGQWNASGEQVIADRLLTTGSHVLDIALPNALPVITYARFRLSTRAGLSPLGDAPDGEVEDFRITAATQGVAGIQFEFVDTSVAAGSLSLPPGTGFDDLDEVRAGTPLSLELTEAIRDDTAPPPGHDFDQTLVDRFALMSNLEFLTADLRDYGNAGLQLVAVFEAYRQRVEQATGRTLVGAIQSTFTGSDSYSLSGGVVADGALAPTAVVGQADVDFYEVFATLEFLPDPALSIDRSNSMIRVSWPLAYEDESYADWILKRTPLLYPPPIVWTNVSPPYSSNAVEYFHIDGAADPIRFFRLFGPEQ